MSTEGNGQGKRPSYVGVDACRLLLEVLIDLESASELISVLISDALAGSTDRETVEQLYLAKGGVACAIEEAKKHLPMIDG